MTEYQTDALTPEHVDLTKPLSEDMKLWLLNRNRSDLLEQNAALLAKEAPSDEPPTGSTESPGDDDEDDYENWTVKELAEEAGARSLTKSGTKDELVARLRAHDEGAL